MLAFFRPPFFSDAAFRLVLGQVGHVLAAVLDGLRITAEKTGNVFHTTVAKFHSLHGSIATSVLFRQGFIEMFHVAFNGQGIADHDSSACYEGYGVKK